MKEFTPGDCRFGLVDNFESGWNDSTVAILLSVPDGKFARDDVDEDMIEDFPKWLAGRSEAECFYSAPGGWTLDQTREALEALGFIHEKSWDNDYGA